MELRSGASATFSVWSRTRQPEFCRSRIIRPDNWNFRRDGDEAPLDELGYEVTLVNHVDSQSAKAWTCKRGLGRMKHVMLKYMFVQDVVEKKQTTLAC